MDLNESKRLFGLPVPIEPEEKSLVLEIGWRARCDIIKLVETLVLDPDPMLQAFRKIIFYHSHELMKALVERKR
jgi:hypothetical protein